MGLLQLAETISIGCDKPNARRTKLVDESTYEYLFDPFIYSIAILIQEELALN